MATKPVRIPENYHQLLKEESEKRKLSMSTLVVLALEKFLPDRAGQEFGK